jgi:hypothetical protein
MQMRMFKWMEENLHRFEGIEFEVREVYIMSRVGPDPSKYEVRHVIPLGGCCQAKLQPYFPELPLPDSYAYTLLFIRTPVCALTHTHTGHGCAKRAW